MTSETVKAGGVNKHDGITDLVGGVIKLLDGVTDHVGGVIKLLDQVPEKSFL